MSIREGILFTIVGAGCFVGGMGLEHSLHRTLPWDNNVTVSCHPAILNEDVRAFSVYELEPGEPAQIRIMPQWDPDFRKFPNDRTYEMDSRFPLGCVVTPTPPPKTHWWE